MAGQFSAVTPPQLIHCLGRWQMADDHQTRFPPSSYRSLAHSCSRDLGGLFNSIEGSGTLSYARTYWYVRISQKLSSLRHISTSRETLLSAVCGYFWTCIRTYMPGWNRWRYRVASHQTPHSFKKASACCLFSHETERVASGRRIRQSISETNMTVSFIFSREQLAGTNHHSGS